MAQTTVKRAPPLGRPYGLKRSSTSPLCRITGKSHSMDEHHYVPSPDDYPKFENVSGCRITEKHEHFKDYKYFYPVLDLDGTTRMITEHDFHCRVTAKYRAMAGHKYIYPVLGATTNKTVNDMESVAEEESMSEILIPSEVEHIIRGGIQDILRLKGNEYLFIYSNEGSIFPAALKEIPQKRKSPRSKYNRRHTLPVNLEAVVLPDPGPPPEMKRLKDIKKQPVQDSSVFETIQENVHVLKDVRKSRPKRPGKHKHKDIENPSLMKKSKQEMEGKENLKEVEEEKPETPPQPRLSRLERFKMQFSQFEAPVDKDSGNRLTLVGAFDESEVVELDFGEAMDVKQSPDNFASATISDPPLTDPLAPVPTNHAMEPSKISENLTPEMETSSCKPVVKKPPVVMTYNISVLISGNGPNNKHTNLPSQDIIPSYTDDSNKLISNQTSDLDVPMEVNSDQEPGIDLKLTPENNLGNNGTEKEFMLSSAEASIPATNSSNSPHKDPFLLNNYVESEGGKALHCNGEVGNDSLRRFTSGREKNFVSWKSIDNLDELNKDEMAEIPAMEEPNKSYGENPELPSENTAETVFVNDSLFISTDVNTSLECRNREVLDLTFKNHNIQSEVHVENMYSQEEKRSFVTDQLNSGEVTESRFNDKVSTKSPASYAIDQNHVSNDIDFEEIREGDVKPSHREIPNGKVNPLYSNLYNNSFISELKQRVAKLNPEDSGEVKSTDYETTIEQQEKVPINGTSLNEVENNELPVSSVTFRSHKSHEQNDDKVMQNQLGLFTVEDICAKRPFSLIENVSKKVVKETCMVPESTEKDIDSSGKNKPFDSKMITEQQIKFPVNGASLNNELPVSSVTCSIHKSNEQNEDKVIQNQLGLSTAEDICDKHAFSLNEDVSKKVIKEECMTPELTEKDIENNNYTVKASSDHSISQNGFIICNGISDKVVTDDTEEHSKYIQSSKILDNNLSENFDGSLKNKQIKQPEIINGFYDKNSSEVADKEILKKFAPKCIPENPLESHILFSMNCRFAEETEFEEQFMLNSLQERLPVTCGLLEKEKLHSTTPTCEQDGIFSPSGMGANMREGNAQRREHAKWNTQCLQGIDVYVAIMDFKPMESDEEAIAMKEGQQVEILDASKPRRWLVRTLPMSIEESPREGWVPACYLEKSTAYETLSSYAITDVEMDPKALESMQNREAIVKELVETEEDFAKDMQYVVDNYYKQMDNPRLPKELRDRKNSIFGNFKDISDFHNNVLIKGVQYHAKEPTKLGKTFLRLERDFDMHANYCWNEARAQQLLREGPLKDYFDDHSKMIDDDKILEDHLKLPIQRLNDYQLLLKELIKYSSRLNEDTVDLQKALDFIHSINKRTKDLQIVLNIQDCRGDLLKLGRIAKHEAFDVIEVNQDVAVERYVLLFKGRLFITEKLVTSGKESYHVTQLFKLQDVEIIEDCEPCGILFRSHKKNRPGFPLLLRARSVEQKNSWCKELATANQVVEDLGDLEPSIERPSDQKEPESLELKHKAEEPSEEPEFKKPKVDSLKRQDSVKKKSKSAESSAPQTPIDEDGSQPPLTRQESVKKKSKAEDSSAPQTPTDTDKAPRLTRQDSVKKKPKDSSAPQTPTEASSTAPSLTRQDSAKKKPKKSTDKEAEVIPEEGTKGKVTRQESLGKKDKKAKADSEDTSKVKPQRQESLTKKEKEEAKPPQEAPKPSGKEKPKPEVDPMDKPRFSKTLRGVTCALGENATLECETEGSPEPSVTWLKDNQKLAKSDRIRSSSKGQKHSLTLKEVTADDGGLYTAVASSSKGSASCSAPLNLKIPLLGLPKEDSRPTTPGGTVLPHAPVFKVKLNKETQLLEGTSVRFELVVRGNPEPEVKFYKDDKELKLDDRVRVSYESKEVFELILDHVGPKDAGTYSCMAKNSEGEDKTVGTLSVVKHKDVFKGLEDSLEEEREPTPRPKTPKFKWFKDGQYFEANERFQVIFNEEEDSLALMFQHVTPEDAGLYTCVASTSTGSKIACSAELTVQGVIRQVEAPAIKAELSDAEATEGGSAMLELKITGYPKPKVTWYHKNKEVSTGGRFRFLFADEESFTLVIKNVKKDDSGKYTVKATNEMGEAESSCNLTVKSAPSFIKGLKDMSIMADEVIKFEVQIDGNPVPDIKWYKDGQQLTAGDRIKIIDEAGKQILKISNAKLTDSGSYSCVVTNNLGSQAEFSNVVVKASPTFIKGMENAEGMEGDTLKFSIEINGNPKPTIKWTKDGKELALDGKRIKVIEEGANAYSLVIDKATASDIGVYTCELRNEHGLKASSGNLNLKMKPEFIKKLSDTACNEGDLGLVLNTLIKGYPQPSVKWFLSDVELKEDKNYAIVTEKESGSHSLKLKRVNRSLAGKYTCEATNEMGKASTNATLTVNVITKKPEIDQILNATQLVEGKSGKLIAKVSGEPKPKIKWYKDGKPILPGDHFSVEETDDGTVSLIISKVTSDDAGLYSIVATSDEGEAKSEAPVTTIPAGRKPEFTKELQKVDLVEGQPLNLQAKVIGKPTSIKWQKDGEDIAASDRIRIIEEADGTIALMIDKVNQNDAGKYTVIASNAEGKARTASLVQVQAVKEPEILASLEPLTLKDGETGTLKVKVSGQPKPTLKWFKDGKELRPSNRVESVEEPDGTVALTIKNSRLDDAGTYSIVAVNPKGEVKSAAAVIVNQEPTFQKPLEPVNVVEGFPARLEAKLSGSPPPEIKWMKDGKELIPDGSHIKEIRNPDGTIALLIDKCMPEDEGRYSLTAVNPLGENTCTARLGVSEKESLGSPKSAPTFVSPLGNLSVKEGEPIRFEAVVSGNPLPDISWILNGQVLNPCDNTLMTFNGEKAILEIKKSSPDHIGIYQCKLSNTLGEASSEGSVSVLEKSAPHFIQRLNDYTGFENQPLKLMCKVTGYPEPELEWYFNGDLITGSPKYSITKAGETVLLNLTSAQLTDTGVYECSAKNSVGEDHTRCAINISDKLEKGEPPMFLKKIGDNEVMEGMTAKFTACITGIPTPDVSWVKEGKPLEPTSRHKMELESTGILRLIIREVESDDYGNYSVTISNIHGSATSSAKLCPDSLDEKYIMPIGDQFVDFDKFKKTGAPVPLSEKPRIIRMDDNFLTLGWKPSVPNAPRVPVTYQLEIATHPDGEWTPYKIGLKDTLCDVRDLKPGKDYKFRIKVENKHGVSEPSPYTIAHRSKIYELPKPQDFTPKDYEIEHPPLQKYAAPPRFLRREEDTMYGVRGHPVTVEFWVYGHPEPKVTWFKGESQIGKDKYTFMQDRNGKVCTFIDCMTDEFVGTYTCLAVNDEGEATMKIKLKIAETPVFIEKLDETTSMSRRSGRMQCRVTGVPYPKIKWFRDWHPLYESERIKVLWEEPDKCTLFISNLITRDNALYSCTATNIAGTATSSAILNVEDSEDIFDAKTYCRPIPIRTRTKLFEDFYDIGEELGRGTQGITYHAVKRETGDSYAAKSMHGKGKLKEFMKSEMDIMNQLCHPKLVRLKDAFEAKDTLTLVTDICGGGELLSNVLKRGGVTEREVAHYIKQILEGLDYMHSRYVGHLGLTIGDVMVARVNSYDIKFGDFGLAARLLPGKDYFLEYGHPEYVAPEIANKQPATLLSDMWSVGVMTYLLLSGISPFLGENDRETLSRVQQGKINFIEDAFIGVSDDAKDFMSKLLVFDPTSRMDVKTALRHRWFKYYPDELPGPGKPLNNLDRLKEYQKKWREWYDNASCKRYYRRRTLESCFHHPSRMIYPPGESYTPPSSPEPDLDRTHVKPSQFDDVTFRQKINREEIDFRSESSYQNGPDTYLLQLRDTDFPLRLRQYLRVGASTSPTLAASLRDRHWGDSTLVIRERRKFVDIMDEEIDDEVKGLANTTVPRRLYHEVGTLGFAREQMELLKKEVWKDKGSREVEIGMAPYFREKMRTTSMKEGDEVVLRCYAIGKPKVDYSWFRNDGILLESSRIVVKELKDGHCELRINPTRAYDAGVYKCVARNMHGVSCCRARLKLGSKPGRPEAPIVKNTSDTEIYITWAVPRDEGQSTTLGYTLEYKKSDEEQWTVISNNIEHEYFVVRNLLPSTFYQFRVKAYNKFGWGEPGFPTEPLTTKPEGAEKVKTSPRRKYQQEFTERTPDYELKEIELPELDYSLETNPVPLTEGEPLELYRIVSEMDRGRFSVVLNVWVKESNTSSVAKIIQKTDTADGKDEYEIMKSLCHEKIVMLFSASHHADKTVLVLEKLSGVDVMSYLALRHDYNEELLAIIIRQVLEALQYLHFREICYIELQPDNVVMVNLRDSDIKLVDFGSARFVPKAGRKVKVVGTPDYLAPEVLKNEEVSSLTDVWCVGILTYILLSGVSPFLGKNDEETIENVTYVRYHFDNMHSDVTSEVTRFLLNIFKQCPIKRLTIDECLEHKWLSLNEYMIMKRESARFLPDKLASFAKKFHMAKYDAMNPELLTSLGMSSAKGELIIDF